MDKVGTPSVGRTMSGEVGLPSMMQDALEKSSCSFSIVCLFVFLGHEVILHWSFKYEPEPEHDGNDKGNFAKENQLRNEE